MKVIPPLDITAARLTSSTAAEPGPGETAWTATAVFGAGDKSIIGTLSSDVTISNASPAVIGWASNSLAIGTAVVLSTTGGLPAGLTAGTTYYVRDRLTTGTITLSATPGGAAINTTSAGSGTHTATAHVHRVYEALIGAAAEVTITIATPGVVTWAGHGRAANDAIVFTTTGALPTGLTAGTTYYVLAPTTDTFTVSATSGGAAIATSGTQSGTHRAGLVTTYNKPPMLNASVWLDVGPTNKWAMFDVLRNTRTVKASPLTVVITPGERIDSLAVLGAVANAASISVSSVLGGGVVYTNSADLNDREVGNWYEYFFAEFSTRPSLVLFDLPPYVDAVITVTLTATSGDVECGACVVGMHKYIGQVLAEAESDVLNFSTVERNAFGDAAMVQRRNVPKTVQNIIVEKSSVNRIRALRDALNAAPAVWAGLPSAQDQYFEAMLILGFYRRFTINLRHSQHAIISLDLEEV